MSGPRRADQLARLEAERFDLLIVGGGINGAGIARDAALRGLAVALVERDDFAAGTSSRSSRLVHGGVRYLEHGYLHLVFEASAERRTLLQIAPHLVRPLPFTWPVYEGARIPRWKLGAGLFLYDLLAAFRNVGNHQRLAAEEVLAREPQVRRDGLTGGAMYYDAATHDTRLTWENVLDAALHGAAVVNHAEVVAFAREGDGAPAEATRGHGNTARITGARVRDRLSGREFTVRAQVVINAAGPWHDDVRRLDEPAHVPGVKGTKGVHIEVERFRIGNRDAITVISGVDGRVMFVLPAGPHAIIGTTDTPTNASPDDVRADQGDVDYLLESANLAFPDAHLTRADVISAWAGIRPLIAAGNTSDPASASREHAIVTSASGVVSVTGGKLTTYRSMSEEVVDVAVKRLDRLVPKGDTDDRPLPGGNVDDLPALLAHVRDVVGAEDIAEQLVHSYGSEWASVWRLCEERPELRARVVGGLPEIRAELVWAAREEMAMTLADLFVRRTPLAFQLRDNARGIAREVAQLVAPELGWDAAAIEAAVVEWEREATRLFAIDR